MVEVVVMGLAAVFAAIIVLAGSSKPVRGRAIVFDVSKPKKG